MFKLFPMVGCAALLASCGPYYMPEPYPARPHRTHQDYLRDQEREATSEYRETQDSYYSQDPPPQTTPRSSSSNTYPTAEKTSNPDQVLSPYPPYNVIDVAGFRSGQLARDPSNQKIFRVP